MPAPQEPSNSRQWQIASPGVGVVSSVRGNPPPPCISAGQGDRSHSERVSSSQVRESEWSVAGGLSAVAGPAEHLQRTRGRAAVLDVEDVVGREV